MNEGANTLVDTYMKAQLIDYVITFLGFLDPPPPHPPYYLFFIIKNKKKKVFTGAANKHKQL